MTETSSDAMATMATMTTMAATTQEQAAANHPAPQQLTLTRPDDWHIHLRDGEALLTTVAHAAQSFNRVMCMPNLVPPVKTAQAAMQYRQRIMEALHSADDAAIDPAIKASFDPRMTLYLTDHTTVEDIKDAAQSGIVQAVKLYPAGATTNSADGVTNLASRHAVFAAMQTYGMPLLIHGEVTDAHVDIFDREQRFVDDILTQLVQDFPALNIVVEHITTREAAQFVLAQGDNVAATITPQHLLLNRNHLLVGGIKPHFYCLPILKRQIHQQALLKVATSGNPKFFLGTDSAPHATAAKENACGCAGCYSAAMALPLYATAFASVGCIDKLEGFASHFGAQFYGLPINTQTVTLINRPMLIPSSYPYMNGGDLTPLMAGETLPWSII